MKVGLRPRPAAPGGLRPQERYKLRGLRFPGRKKRISNWQNFKSLSFEQPS